MKFNFVSKTLDYLKLQHTVFGSKVQVLHCTAGLVFHEFAWMQKTWLNCSQLRKLFSKNKQTNFLGRPLRDSRGWELTSRSTKRLGYPILLTLSPQTLKMYQYLSFHQNLWFFSWKKPCFWSRLDQDWVVWLFRCHIDSVQW